METEQLIPRLCVTAGLMFRFTAMARSSLLARALGDTSVSLHPGDIAAILLGVVVFTLLVVVCVQGRVGRRGGGRHARAW